VGVLTEVGGGTNDDIAVVQSQGPIRQDREKKNVGVTHTPSTPVSTATRASSMWQRM
jgi:hypothetical protein